MNQLLDFLYSRTPLLYLTQSLWRDEAYSVWISKDGIHEAIIRTSGDFNPPLYYILLHMWMRLFGDSEVMLRSFSLVVFVFFLAIVYRFARVVYASHNTALFTTVLMAINPMLLYYAFEARMYSLLMLFATLSMYFFYSKKWKSYVLSTAVGLYTQPYMLFVVLAQSLYLFFKRQFHTLLKNNVGIVLLYLPWISTLISQLKASGPMWIPPPDSNLVLAALASLYTGFEGTPPHWWPIMQLESFVIAVIIGMQVVYSFVQKHTTQLLFGSWALIPVVLVVGISFIKPIYVNRYVIYVVVALVFILTSWLMSIKKRTVRQFLALQIIGITLGINFLIAPYHKKVPIKNTFANVASIIKPRDVIYAASPLVFYESLYYAPAETEVFLYNPLRIPMPRFVGSVGMPEDRWATEPPFYPKRAFLIQEDGTYETISNNK